MDLPCGWPLLREAFGSHVIGSKMGGREAGSGGKNFGEESSITD